jgi:hypothetical protein
VRENSRIDDRSRQATDDDIARLLADARTPGQLTVAQVLDGCSRQLVRLGRGVEAEALARESLALRTAQLPPDAPDLARSLVPLGAARRALGNPADAHAIWDRALALASRGPDDVAAARRAIAGFAR